VDSGLSTMGPGVQFPLPPRFKVEIS